MKRIAISQSNYLPWKGYFDTIASVDEFVLYDEVQYTRRDWRNRNVVKTAAGLKWLTVPVAVKGRFEQRIDEVHISDASWAAAHARTLHHAYARAPHYAAYAPAIDEILHRSAVGRLSDLNRALLQHVMDVLGIGTVLRWSTEYAGATGRNERLVAICREAGATDYLTGPAAKAYLDESLFAAAGVAVHYVDYGGYDEYPQLHGTFEHAVSIVDLLFNTGPDAARYLKLGRTRA